MAKDAIIKKCVELRAQGLTLEKISKQVDRSITTVWNYIYIFSKEEPYFLDAVKMPVTQKRRIRNALKKADLEQPGQIAAAGYRRLYRISGLGPIGRARIVRGLKRGGFISAGWASLI